MLNNSLIPITNYDALTDLVRQISCVLDEAVEQKEYAAFSNYFNETKNRLECTYKILSTDPDELKLDLIKGKFLESVKEFQVIHTSILNNEQALKHADQARQEQIQLANANLKDAKQKLLIDIHAKLRKVYNPTLIEYSKSIALDYVGAAFSYLTKGVGFGSSLMYLISGSQKAYKNYKDNKGWGALAPIMTAFASCFIAEAIRHLTSSNPYSIYAIFSLGITTNLINRIEEYIQLKREISKVKFQFQNKKQELKKRRAQRNNAFADEFKIKEIDTESKLTNLKAKRNEIISLAQELEEIIKNKQGQAEENNEISQDGSKPSFILDFHSKSQLPKNKRKRDEDDNSSNKIIKYT